MADALIAPIAAAVGRRGDPCPARTVGALGRALLAAGALSGIIAAIVALPNPTDTIALPLRLAGEAVAFRLEPEALWLFGFRSGAGSVRLRFGLSDP